MKKLILLLASFLVFCGDLAFAQTKKELCSSLHEGKFSIKDPDGGNLILERTKKFQKEIAEFGAIVIKMKIVWTDECHYELHGMKMIKGPNKKEWKNLLQETVYVEILEVTPKYHTIKCQTKSNGAVTFFTVWHAKK